MNEPAPAKPAKPLGGKAYGSIPHLPGSRLGPGDWHITEGQARILCEKPRPGDRIIVTEKLDGACVAVAKIDGQLVPLIRAGYRTEDAEHVHLREFGTFTSYHFRYFDFLLREGERIVGEWLSLAHGTRYRETEPGFSPFVAFDIIDGIRRLTRAEFTDRMWRCPWFTEARVIHDGAAGFSIDQAAAALAHNGFHGAMDGAEGAVWRVEREGAVEFTAKWVRPEKVDGRFLPEVSGGPPLWNWRWPWP